MKFNPDLDRFVNERRERVTFTGCVDCDELIDAKDHRTLNCGRYGGWTARHDEIRDVLYPWMIRGNIDVVREKKGHIIACPSVLSSSFFISYMTKDSKWQ